MTRKILIGTFIMAASFSSMAFAENREARFDKLDTNADGALSEAEIKAAGAARFAEADADGDGALSKEELLERSRNRSASRVDRMMERLDADNDGKLTMAELEARPRRGDVFARLDANNDGSISKEEFEARRKMRKQRSN